MAKNKLIVALDYNNLEDCKNMVELLGDRVQIYKIGLESFLFTESKIIDYLKEKKKKIFLDLKFHDITNTVKKAVEYVIEKDIFMFNIHAQNSAKTIKEISDLLKEKKSNTLFITVSILTNILENDLKNMYQFDMKLEKIVENLAILSEENGANGIVCSALESKNIKEKTSKNFLTVCPGIRFKDSLKDDQERIMTPYEAILNGADYLVVGRLITNSKNPIEITDKILLEIEKGINKNG